CSTDRYFLHWLYVSASTRRHTRTKRDWSSDVCSSDLPSCNTVKYTNRVEPRLFCVNDRFRDANHIRSDRYLITHFCMLTCTGRSEERRVGKECRSGWER